MSAADVMSVRLVSVDPDETAHAAVEKMLASGVGAVVVCEESRLLGIFTERDVLRLVGANADLHGLPVREVMTSHPVEIGPDDDVFAIARLMGEKRIRHLPIVQDGNVLGVVGIRDVMRSLVERIWREQDGDARDTARELLRRG